MLATRLPGVLPDLTPAEALEVSMIHSVAGLLRDGQLVVRPPFRDPHHSASQAALAGGGNRARPGEISLAHHGVLFLDEWPEFPRPALEALRQPMETGHATISRANAHVTYPARFQCVAAMNPCRCGHLDDAAQACPRAPRCGADYQARISGPLLDRIDLHVEVPALNIGDLTLPTPREGSAEVAARVSAARSLQADRFAALGRPELRTNGEAEGELLERIARCDEPAHGLLRRAASQLALSARGYHRVLRVARTIADLDGSETIRKPHIAEAVAFRRIARARV
jgi:magnesium chelatase family protein